MVTVVRLTSQGEVNRVASKVLPLCAKMSSKIFEKNNVFLVGKVLGCLLPNRNQPSPENLFRGLVFQEKWR